MTTASRLSSRFSRKPGTSNAGRALSWYLIDVRPPLSLIVYASSYRLKLWPQRSRNRIVPACSRTSSTR